MANIFKKIFAAAERSNKKMMISSSGSTPGSKHERIRSGQSYLYQTSGMESEVVEVRFHKKVSGSCLNQALLKAMERYPYTDGMRIMREILVDITKNYGCTVLISSHILGELEKIATHYGIIRQGGMVQELSAKEMEGRCRVFVELKTKNMTGAKKVLREKYSDVRSEENALRVYDVDDTEGIVEHLIRNGHIVSEIRKNKIGLEEYYIELMSKKEGE